MEQKTSEICREQATQLLDFACHAYRLGMPDLANDLVYKAEETDGDFVQAIPLGVPKNRYSVLVTGLYLGNIRLSDEDQDGNAPASAPDVSNDPRIKTLFIKMLNYAAKQPVMDDLSVFLNEKILERDDENTIALFNLGCVNLSRSKIQGQDVEFLTNRAAQYFGRIIQIDPDFAHAHYRLGECYCKMSMFTQARACFEKELEINPQHASSHFALACMVQSSDPDLACLHVDKAFNIAVQDPDNVEAIERAQNLKMRLNGRLSADAGKVDFTMN